MISVRYPVVVVSVFLWIGFVCAISFMEAWLKFRAPGITVPLGLGIGRLVFGALNKVEWVFAIAIGLNLFIPKVQQAFVPMNLLYLLPLGLLILQSVWLLPVLDARAGLHLQNQVVPPSNLHFYYVGMELVKIICLGVFGLLQFK